MEHQKSKLLNWRRPILWIVLLGFVLRLGSMAVNYEQMRWQNDARVSIPAARILEGKGLTLQDGAGPTAYRPPLYILWLSMGYAVFGTYSKLGPSFLQILVSTGNIVLLFLLAKQLWKREDAANASALLLAVHPYTVYHDAALYHTFLSTALLLGGFLLLFRGAERKKAKPFFFSGLLFGLCILILGTIAPFILLAMLVGFFAWKIAWKQRALLVGMFALGLLLAWGPWIIRNAVAFGHFVPLTTESGVTLWIGNSPYAKELLPIREQEATPVPEGTAFNIPERYVGCKPEGWCRGGVSEYEESQGLTKLATEWIKSHPMEFVELSIWRFAGIWSPFLTPAKTFSSSNTINFLITYGFFAWNMLLFVFFVIGTRMRWRERRWEWLLMVGLALSSTAAYALFLYFTKYRIPFEAVLLAVAGLGAAEGWRRAKRYLPLRAVK